MATTRDVYVTTALLGLLMLLAVSTIYAISVLIAKPSDVVSSFSSGCRP